MNNKNSQKGVGMVEVLVSLLILAIGILGFIALQYRASESTLEAGYRIQAINLARDLSERIRVNRNQYEKYQTEISTASNQKNFAKDCTKNACSKSELADFDVAQVVSKAQSVGMTMNIMKCQGNVNERNCIYVAWGDTAATDGTDQGNCTNKNSYVSNSTCLIMETY
jgi:type IV pilus assembly protein PilV